ncbi:MAG: phospho-N-acetylmuramoyl-pentapeptide-transferase [Oligoflexia bacterium]|nr:phospho-N-acetylmuramoyl-pentapeptide-transferase [Oligoflexia bacterium]MBF0364805.1 phospho-N-acetylmuramoyl-pentapeptide-transferase [Oligoflexia bacterium]
MLYHILFHLKGSLSFLNICKYITFRSFVAFLLVALLFIFLGKWFIELIRAKQFGQVVRDDGPLAHLKKAGTPTCGGILIVACIFAGLMVAGNFFSPPLLATTVIMLSYFALGFWDDFLKISKKNSKGVSAKMKLLWQFVTAAIVLLVVIKLGFLNTQIFIPFIKGGVADIGLWYVLFGSIVIVGSSNAVNLTDGLDGLAIGSVITSAATLGIMAYVSGHRELANYLYIPYVDHAGELAVLASAMVGAGVGFLWFNSHPAQIFMGDAGSLSLGGILGAMAVFTKNEFLFVLIGGVFVVEALSVIIQVLSFKTRGKRVFKMAPIHHHFELLGVPESKLIVRFWIVSIALAIMSLVTLKIR